MMSSLIATGVLAIQWQLAADVVGCGYCHCRCHEWRRPSVRAWHNSRG